MKKERGQKYETPKKPTGVSTPCPRSAPVASLGVDAVFLGYQQSMIFVGKRFPLFNIIKKNHPYAGSTVGLKTLKRLGLKIPNYKQEKK